MIGRRPRPREGPRRCLAAVAALAAVGLGVAKPRIAAALAPPPAADSRWELITSGVRTESPHNDGDSVAVRVNGRTVIFRLCFVDAIEANPRSTGRLARQAAHFGIPEDKLDAARGLALRAGAFTKAQTSGPLRVWTRWEPVSPRSGNPSIRAFIEGRDGDLALLLVRSGLALIKSGPAVSPHPDGRSVAEILRELESAEEEARQARRGGWAFSEQVAPADPAGAAAPPARKDGVFDAGDTARLLDRTGLETSVEGVVGRVSHLPDGRVHFINFEGNTRADFYAVIRGPDIGRLRGVFGAAFPGDLHGRRLRVSGRLAEHKGAPQIEISLPGQIEILR